MPCYRCGARQTDPDRGQSPWRRGVRHDCQILVCPDCQAAHDWTADLAHCPQCGSVHLVRRLGEVECRDCGCVVPPVAGHDGDPVAADAGGPADAGSADAGTDAGADFGGFDTEGPAAGAASALAEEVALALERVLGRGSARKWAVK